MNSIFVVLIVGAFAAIALAVPFSPDGQQEVLKRGRTANETQGRRCIPNRSKDRTFPAEGLRCHCKRTRVLGRWECKPYSNSTTTTTPEPVTQTDSFTATTDPATEATTTEVPPTDSTTETAGR